MNLLLTNYTTKHLHNVLLQVLQNKESVIYSISIHPFFLSCLHRSTVMRPDKAQTGLASSFSFLIYWTDRQTNVGKCTNGTAVFSLDLIRLD